MCKLKAKEAESISQPNLLTIEVYTSLENAVQIIYIPSVWKKKVDKVSVFFKSVLTREERQLNKPET